MEIMDHPDLLVSAITKDADDIEAFDTRFAPFYFKGQDQGLYFPNEEIDEYKYFILEECDRQWGKGWAGVLVQHWLCIGSTGHSDMPEGYDDKFVFYKELK